MPTCSTLPVRLCLRSLMNVSVIAVTSVIGPLSQSAVSMQWASRSPVTPLPAAATSSRQRPAPPCGRSAEIVQSWRKLRAVVEDAAELAFVDQLLGQGDGGHAAVVVPDRVRHAGGFSTASTISLALGRGARRAASRTGPSCRPWRRRWRSRDACCSGLQMSMASMSLRSISFRQSVSIGLVAPVVGELLDAVLVARRRPP